MSLYAAIDLHSSNSVLAVMDGDGKAVLRCRRPNDLPRLLNDLAPYRSSLVGAWSRSLAGEVRSVLAPLSRRARSVGSRKAVAAWCAWHACGAAQETECAASAKGRS